MTYTCVEILQLQRVRMSECLCASENQAYHRSLLFVSP